MRYLLVPTVPLLIGLTGLAAFTSLPTAILFLGVFSFGAWRAFAYWEKHHASERWDSKLTDRRMAEALGEWVVTHKNEN